MESAEQPTKLLHKKVGGVLQRLGYHTVSTIPPNEGPVLAKEVREMAEDLGYTAKTALEQAVSGGVTHVRTTKDKKPISIASIREELKNRFFRRKAA